MRVPHSGDPRTLTLRRRRPLSLSTWPARSDPTCSGADCCRPEAIAHLRFSPRPHSLRELAEFARWSATSTARSWLRRRVLGCRAAPGSAGRRAGVGPVGRWARHRRPRNRAHARRQRTAAAEAPAPRGSAQHSTGATPGPQANDGVNHALRHLRKARKVSGPLRSHLSPAHVPSMHAPTWSSPKRALQCAARCQEVSGTQVAGVRLLEPYWGRQAPRLSSGLPGSPLPRGAWLPEGQAGPKQNVEAGFPEGQLVGAGERAGTPE